MLLWSMVLIICSLLRKSVAVIHAEVTTLPLFPAAHHQLSASQVNRSDSYEGHYTLFAPRCSSSTLSCFASQSL
jgi:hypothetical protein